MAEESELETGFAMNLSTAVSHVKVQERIQRHALTEDVLLMVTGQTSDLGVIVIGHVEVRSSD